MGHRKLLNPGWHGRAANAGCRAPTSELGSGLFEVSLSLFLLITVAVYSMQTAVASYQAQAWSVIQTMTDAQASVETAYAQRWVYGQIASSGRWPVYPNFLSSSATAGQTPNGPINVEIRRTCHVSTDPASGLQNYLLESYVTYTNGKRSYCKLSKVLRTQ
jgi:hypothetical protein